MNPFDVGSAAEWLLYAAAYAAAILWLSKAIAYGMACDDQDDEDSK